MEEPIKIHQSASKIVFIIMALAVVALTFARIVEAKDFIFLAGMSFTYYFTRDKGEKQKTNEDTNRKPA